MAQPLLSLLFFFFLSIPSHRVLAAPGCSSETFSSNRVFATCNDLPELSASLHFTYDRTSGDLSLAFVAPPAAPSGWVAWAINPAGGGMVGAQALIAFKQESGSIGVKTYNISGYESVQESPILYQTSDLAAEYGTDGKITLYARVRVGKGVDSLSQVWQVGSSVTNGEPDKHAFGNGNMASKGKLDLVKGISTGSSAGDGSVSKKRNVHGILNVVSWGILIPIGATIARYLKTFKSADPAWFYVHVSCQLIGYSTGVAGWATGLNLGKESKGVTYTTHRNIGITIFTLATLQIFALFLRPNKDNKYRFYWNIYHHSVGYTVIILGIINIFRGLTILNVQQSLRTAYIIFLFILGAIALILEVITWVIVLRRKREEIKPYGGSSNGHQQPFSV